MPSLEQARTDMVQKYHKGCRVFPIILGQVKTKLYSFSLGEAGCRWGNSELESKSDLYLISETPCIMWGKELFLCET